jgi:DNA-binding transcriptional MerR regulator
MQGNSQSHQPLFEGNVPEKADSQFLTIGALAKLCDMTVRTLRYYEEMDLIGPVKRSSGKYRLYNHHSLKRINAISALQGLNFSLDEILKILGPYSKSRSFTKEQQIAQTRESLSQQKYFIHDKITQLATLNADIEHRLNLLDNVCSPCLETDPHASCSENCSFLEVHN